MSQPPSESGNVVDPEVLASRRARRAEVSEDASLELRLFEAERRLGEVAAERDALRAQITGLERDLRGTRQREWAEQQQRLEAQGEAAAARDLAGSQLAELRERLAAAEAELATVAAERDRARRALEDERLRATAERERREALEREGLLLRAELARREDLTSAAADAVAQARRELAASASSSSDLAGVEARVAAEREAFAERVVAVERAVAAVRERLGAAARVLRERVDAERDGRLAAEAALGAERAARVAADGRATSLERERGGFEAALGAERLRVVELERERDAVRGELLAERARVVALERDAASARAEAGALARARERVAELEARLAVLDPARVEALEAEVARRAATEGELRAALQAVSDELAGVRSGSDERIARLTARVESVVALATRVKDGAGDGAELVASLEAMRARVGELSGLREELEAERAARWVAEAELDAERRRGAEDRARLAEVEAELTQLRGEPRPGPDPSTLASLRAALDDLRARTTEPSEADTPSPTLGVDLAAAAARLRAATADTPPSADTPPEGLAAPSTDASEQDDAAPAALPVDAPQRDDAAPAASTEDVAAPAAAPEGLAPPLASPPAADDGAPQTPDLDPFAPTAAAPQPGEATAPERQRLPERTPALRPSAWLRDALRDLVEDEPDIAELLLVSLLPAQAGLAKGSLAYELSVDGGTTHRVLVDPDRARVELPGAGTVDARVSGPLAALVPLATGGAGRRLPGTRIEGRRPLRRIIKARRAPLGLAELAAAGIAPSPGLLLTVLARAVEPRWTAGRPLSVDVAPEGADRWRVIASGNGPLAILPAEGAPPANATLHTSASRLPAVLAGTADPDDAHVEGDLRDVRTLLSWLDRAQRN